MCSSELSVKMGTTKKQIILPSLESKIEVGQEINVASGKFD